MDAGVPFSFLGFLGVILTSFHHVFQKVWNSILQRKRKYVSMYSSFSGLRQQKTMMTLGVIKENEGPNPISTYSQKMTQGKTQTDCCFKDGAFSLTFAHKNYRALLEIFIKKKGNGSRRWLRA